MSRLRLQRLTMTAMFVVLGAKVLDLLQTLNPSLLVPSAMAATDGTTVLIPPPAPSGPAPGTTATPLGAPPISDTERAVLLDLRQRRAALDAREARIATREQLLLASERRLDVRLDQLTALQTRLQALDAARQQREAANWAGLVQLYEAMPPRDAATIFNGLDMAVLLPVVDRMKDRKAAAILAAMDADRARLLTTRLAAARLHATSVGAGGGS